VHHSPSRSFFPYGKCLLFHEIINPSALPNSLLTIVKQANVTASLTPIESATSSTKIVSAPRPSLNVTTVVPPPLSPTLVFTSTISKNATTTVPTGAGGASASASYSAPPEFTAAAAGVQIGAAALIGGMAMALFA
jgi:hypothetical protein